MKRYFALLLLLCFFTTISEAQELFKTRRMEAVGGVGISQFFGDIGGFSQTEDILGLKDIILNQTRFTIEGAIKYRVIPEVSLKLSFNFGMFHASDAKGSNEDRGMEATTMFFEPALTAEYYFIKSTQENKYSFIKGKNIRGSFFSFMDFYAFAGIGGLSYHVKGNEALVTAGMVNSGFTAVIPVGIGVNVNLNPDYNLGLELGGRYSFSDYLDGYSPQYSKSNDVYYFLTFTFTYKIPTRKNGMPKFLSKSRF
jgi:Domain of unknown function (DUF6089)